VSDHAGGDGGVGRFVDQDEAPGDPIRAVVIDHKRSAVCRVASPMSLVFSDVDSSMSSFSMSITPLINLTRTGVTWRCASS